MSETAVEETTAAEATASPSDASLVEIEIATASDAKTLKMDLLGVPATWMYWWLTDNGKTIHYSKTEPTTVTNYYGVDSGSGSIYDSYEGAGIDKSKIEKAVFENEIVADTCANFFAEFINLNTITNLDYLDTNRVTNMSHMFFDCQKLISLDLSSFNTSSVISMDCLFSYCTELTYVDLSGFDTSNVTNMYLMFYDCESIQNLDLRNFDTRQVTNMKFMFEGCHELETILVSNLFDTSLVSNENSEQMFYNCSKLKGGAGTTYDDSNPKDKTYAHIDEGSSNPGYFTDASIVPWMYWRLEDNETGKTIIFSSTNKDGSTPITGDAEINYGSLDTNTITKAKFEDVIHAETCRFLFCDFRELIEIETISNLKTNRVRNMGSMFENCSKLKDLDISSFNTSNVENMEYMFIGCKFDSLDFRNSKNFVTGKVTTMFRMFGECSNLKELDLRRFNTSSVTNMYGMFEVCTSLTTIYVSNTFVTGSVTESDRMFNNCSNLKGGAGTTYDSNYIDKEYARIDGGTSNPGYFTNAVDAPWMYWYLTDEDNDGENDTINYSNTPVSAYTCYKVVGTDDLYDNYDSHSLDKTIIKKAIFHNKIEALTCSDLFNEFTVLEEIDSLSNLKTDEVTSMYNMFALCPSLKNIDISSLNTSKVTDMSGMFMACASFTSIDFNIATYFNTSSVTKMIDMFDGCVNLTSLDLSKFNTANVEKMNAMFSGMTGLTKLDLRSFNTSKVDGMSSMFDGCTSLKTIIVSNDFDVTSVGNANNMFKDCTSLVGGKGTTFNPSYRGKDYARIDGGPTSATPGYFTDVATLPWMYWRLEDNDTGKTIIFSSTDEGTTGTTSIAGSAAINYGSLDKDTVTKAVFEDEIVAVTCGELFDNFLNLKEIQDLAKLKTNKVTNMVSMFRECHSLKSFDIEYLDTSNVEDMSYMFYGCMGLTSLDVSNFITLKVKNMYGVFGYCTGLTDLNLNNFNTENVENMQQMFSTCVHLTYLDLSNFNTSKVTDMKKMFYDCRSLETIVVGNNFVTNMVTSSDDMFKYCEKLVGCYGTAYDENKTNKEYAKIEVLDEYGHHPGYFSSAPWMYWYLGHNDTAIHYSSTKPVSGGVGATRRELMVYSGLSDEQREKITKATFENRIDAKTCVYLFANFKDLTSIENLDNLDTTNVEGMSGMFDSCESLESIHIENLYVSNVKSTVGMFSNCKKLKSLELSSWNTMNLERTDLMFAGCSSLTLLDMRDFNTSKVWLMYGMFGNCSSLKELDLSSFDTTNVEDMSNMFVECSSLERIYVSNEFVTTAVTNDTAMFGGCTSIKGSSGTTYDESHIGREYARIDGGTAAPGYFYTNDWMWYKYDDTQKTLYLYGTEPNVYDGVISGSGGISYGTLSRDNVEKVVFENEVKARTCELMFDGFVALKEIVDIENLNTSSVMSMERMFNYCNSLDKIDLSKFDTSRVTNMTGMFVMCRKLDELDVTSFDTSNVINMNGMFSDCSDLTTLDLTKFDTKNVTNFIEFLNGCEKLTSIDLSSFDTSNVKSMDAMFTSCENLETITVSSKFVTTHADYNNDMFNRCNALKGGKGTTYDGAHKGIEYARIDGGPTSATPGYFTRGNWMWWYLDNTGKVLHLTNSDPKNGKATGINSGDTVTYENLDKTRVTKVKFDDYIVADTCNNFFAGFTKLVEIEGLNQLEVEFANKMSWMFSDCESLKSIDMSNFYTSGIKEMACMFEGCSSLTSLDFSKAGDFDTSNVVDMKDMFNGCKKLTTLDLSLFETAKVQYMEGKFSGCSALKSIIVSPGFDTSSVVDDGGFMFKNCTAIVGGKGTTYSADHTNYEYARIDEGPNSLYPGYFTLSGATNVVTISIISNPNKTIYTVGQTLSPAGLRIKVVYSDGSEKVVAYTSGNANEFSFSPSLSTKLTTSDRLVTVTYGGQSTTFAITVRQSGGGNSGDSGSSSGSSGGSGGGPTIAEDVPSNTYLNATSAILGVFASSSSNWSYDPVDNSWQLNSTDANGNAVRAINGLYALTHVRTHIVNGVPMETIVPSVYCLNANAKMVTGWVKTLDGKWFFFENKKNADEGKMVTGWKQIQGAWYYFGEDGAMYIDTVTPDGRRVGADGKLIV